MEAVIGIVILVVIVVVLRLLGAWMLRIDEVIKNQKEMIRLMKKNIDSKIDD